MNHRKYEFKINSPEFNDLSLLVDTMHNASGRTICYFTGEW